MNYNSGIDCQWRDRKIYICVDDERNSSFTSVYCLENAELSKNVGSVWDVFEEM